MADRSAPAAALRGYLVVRFVLALGQLPAHLRLLYHARTDLAAADKLLQRLGSGDAALGTERFYLAVHVCNVMMAVMLGASVWFLRALAVACASPLAGPYLDGLRALEIASASLLALHLGVRLLALALGFHRQWFFLNRERHDLQRLGLVPVPLAICSVSAP